MEAIIVEIKTSVTLFKKKANAVLLFLILIVYLFIFVSSQNFIDKIEKKIWINNIFTRDLFIYKSLPDFYP